MIFSSSKCLAQTSVTFSHFQNIDAPGQLLAKAICICRAQFSPPDQELLKGNLPVSVSPLDFIFFPPFFFYYKSMIEIVCDNRHSNWAGHNDMRARNKLNTIYKSQKWQGLQESVKEERMEGRRCACVCMCARVSMCVCVCFLTPKLLMTSVFLQSKHSPTPNTIQLSNPAPPLNSRAF